MTTLYRNGETVTVDDSVVAHLESKGWSTTPPEPDPGPPIETLRQWKYAEISGDAEYAETDPASNVYSESATGYVNARRKDLDNVRSLVDVVDSIGGQVSFRMFDNTTKTLDKAALEGLKQELIFAGIALYQKKWNLLSLTAAATSAEQLGQIHW